MSFLANETGDCRPLYDCCGNVQSPSMAVNGSSKQSDNKINTML